MFVVKLIILLFTFHCIESAHGPNISHHCVPFVNILWSRKCFGEVTRELKLKYKDRRVEIGTQFAVYSTKLPTMGVIVTFNDSPVSRCEHFIYTYYKKFVCFTSPKGTPSAEEGLELDLNFSNCYCYNFFLGYVSEFVGLCIIKGGNNFGNINLDYSAIHYTRPRQGAKCYYPNVAMILIIEWLMQTL